MTLGLQFLYKKNKQGILILIVEFWPLSTLLIINNFLCQHDVAIKKNLVCNLINGSKDRMLILY